MTIQLYYFPFLFSKYCCPADPRVLWVVYGRCNQSFFALFYGVFDTSYRGIDAIFNGGKSSSSFFSWNIVHLYYPWGIRPYASWAFLFYCPSVEFLPSFTLRMVLGNLRCDKISAIYSLVSTCFLVLLRYSIKFVLISRLF